MPVMRSVFVVWKESGTRHRPLVKQFTGVQATQSLKIALAPQIGSKEHSTVLFRVEIQAEGW